MRWVHDVIQDLRHGARVLRRNPGFTAIAVLTLALGVGANTAIFSVIHSVLLNPLPFRAADRIMLLSEYHPGKVPETGVPYPDYLEWKTQNTSFEQIAAYWNVPGDGAVLGGTGSAERVQFSIVTDNFLLLLGVQPALGRGFLTSEEKPGKKKVFLASDGLWRRSLGGTADSIGKTFLMDGEPYTLVGVMAPSFQFPMRCDVWSPMEVLGNFPLDRVSHEFYVLGTLRAGARLRQAQTEMEGIEGRLAQTYPTTDAGWRVRVRPLIDEYVGNYRTSLLVLFGAVGFVLLIACSNVVNLMLAQASAREEEFGIRAALGASRVRLVSQSLSESLLIVALSVAAGLVLAKWGIAMILSLNLIQIPRMAQFHLDAGVLAFGIGITVVTTILVGLAPALQVSKMNFRDTRRTSSSGRRSQHLRGALVISEVALTLLLLCGAGLMLKSFIKLRSVAPGFNPEHLLTMKIALPDALYTKIEQRTAFLQQLLERLESLPGVKAVAATNRLPLSDETDWGSFNIVGQPVQDWAHARSAYGQNVSANYFRAMSIPVLRGRDFRKSEADVVIINQAMADQFWPHQNPIGQRVIGLEPRARPQEVIGIVGNAKTLGLDAESKPEMYALSSGWWSRMAVVLRGTSNPASMISAVRTEVAALDKNVPIYETATMDQLLGISLAPHRFDLILLAFFAVLALVLAAVGIYGVLAFGVGQRRREFGIRVALGAERRDILRLVLWQGMKLVTIGLLIGLVASAALTRLMTSLLYKVSPTDPLTFAGVAFLFAIVTFLACYIPARPATRVDPMVALRSE